MWEFLASWGVACALALAAVLIPAAALAGPRRSVSVPAAAALVLGALLAALAYLALLVSAPVVDGVVCGTDTVDASHAQSWVSDGGRTFESSGGCVSASRVRFTGAGLAVLLLGTALAYAGTRERQRVVDEVAGAR